MSREKKKVGLEKFQAECVRTYEVWRCYSESYRMETSCAEMKKFLQGSGPENSKVSAACSDSAVLLIFTRSRLFCHDVREELGNWLNDENWMHAASWKFLCERWHERWEKPRKHGVEQGNFISVWRLGCMVEGWRLLDSHYLKSADGICHLYPSVDEISTAALCWLEAKGVIREQMENILNKATRTFEEIAFGWIPRSGLKHPPGPLFEEKEIPEILGGLTESELAKIEQRIEEFDSEEQNRQELEFLKSLDWPE